MFTLLEHFIVIVCLTHYVLFMCVSECDLPAPTVSQQSIDSWLPGTVDDLHEHTDTGSKCKYQPFQF